MRVLSDSLPDFSSLDFITERSRNVISAKLRCGLMSMTSGMMISPWLIISNCVVTKVWWKKTRKAASPKYAFSVLCTNGHVEVSCTEKVLAGIQYIYWRGLQHRTVCIDQRCCMEESAEFLTLNLYTNSTPSTFCVHPALTVKSDTTVCTPFQGEEFNYGFETLS